MRNAGFTLLEVMIAITIIAFLSIFTTQSIQRALQTRGKVQHTIEVNAQMRETLRLMERDLNLAFHYRDFATDLYNSAQTDLATPPANPPPTGGPPNNPAAPPQNPAAPPVAPKPKKDPPIQLTQFIGEASLLNFTSLTNARTTVDEQTSSQSEIGYFLKECRNRKDAQKRSKCLWRRWDPYLDDDVTKGGQQLPLLENVESLQLRYMAEGRDDWTDKWNSKDGPPEDRDKFPLAVEITLTINDTPEGGGIHAKTHKIVMQSVAAIRFPNNKQENAVVPPPPAIPPPPPPAK